MKFIFAFAAGLVLLLPVWPVNAQISADDLKAVRRIEQEWERGWNGHDMNALASLVAEEVDFITVAGIWLKGRRAFREHHARVHAMQFKESVWATTDVQVKSLKPDIALVHVSWSLSGDKDPDGTPRRPRRGVFTRVVTKQGGKWLIQASHNTDIRETAPAK